MGIKFRLIVMNFLQYAIWGSWLISLGAYLGGGLDFTGLQIGSFFATMGIASLFMPAVMGIIADRWIPAQKLLGICHLISGAFLVAAASQTAYAPLYSCMLLSVMFYMPTIALSNSVAYNALDLAKLDTVKHFPPIRVWGTVGFIAAMWFVDLTHIGGIRSSSPLGSSMFRRSCRSCWPSTPSRCPDVPWTATSSRSRGSTRWGCAPSRFSRRSVWPSSSSSRCCSAPLCR